MNSGGNLSKHYVVAIGSSSGGPPILDEILSALPADFPAVVVVLQHLPAHFTLTMSQRLAKKIVLPISQMQNGEFLQLSHAYIVPGDQHFFLTNVYQVKLIEAKSALSPSIDMGFTSLAEQFGPKTIGVVLSGMGEDGVMGARAIKQMGGQVIVQDEDSSAVFGMPKSVQIAGFADEILPPNKIIEKIKELVADD